MGKSFEEKIAEERRVYKTNWNNKLESSYRLTDFDVRQIFAVMHEVDLKKDENGEFIPGTGRIITNEEKKQILDFILENNYPFTKRVYNIVLRAYINEEIELSINRGPKL